ncbi:protein CREG2 isoform X4 [Anas platyrhynchos]|uniref:protein CREG2 isoform X4 n=1 Tax=Anas platyrhynchos TaxID=8839 RepID=UPI003AF30737
MRTGFKRRSCGIRASPPQLSGEAPGAGGRPLRHVLGRAAAACSPATTPGASWPPPGKDNVADLLKDPVASLTLPEADGNFCRKNAVDPEDPRCARLTLTGQMVTVPPEETEFAKQAMFSRHPVIRKWPHSYEWFFMKMNIERIWLQSWYAGVSAVPVEEYLKAAPSKA